MAEDKERTTLEAVAMVDDKLLKPQLNGLNQSQPAAVAGEVHRMVHALVEEHIDPFAMSHR